MALYNVLLLIGGVLILFSSSDGIWNVIAARARQSPVPGTFPWRLVTLVLGVLTVGLGVGGLVFALI